MRNWLIGLFVAVVALAPGFALAEGAWWEKAWPYRKEIILDASPKGANIAQSPGRTAVLVRLHSGNFQFDDAKPDGSDIRFVTEDNKPLNFHMESFDPKIGVGTAWVDITDFPASSTKKVWLYYGNKDAPVAGSSGSTFDADYVLVYHFDGAAGQPVKDKTAYANNALNPAAGVTAAGVAGQAGRFGSGPVNVAPTPSLQVAAGGSFSFSAWVKPATAQSSGVLFARRDGGGSLVIGLDQGLPFVEINGTRATASQAIEGAKWTLVSVAIDGEAGNVTLYVNGANAGAANARLTAMNSQISLGGDTPGGTLAAFAGDMDEVRISKSARPAALVLADFAAQGPASKLVTAGEDEKQGGHGGYFGIIVKSVTIDAWVVIGILGVMAALSWFVMWTKIVYVNVLDGGNNRFLRKYREAGGDPLKMHDEDDRSLRGSSIWRIYKEGADEIRRRSKDGRPVLHAEAIQVIRSLMDATLVRENQRLSSGLVWLTIAISGGPFLGLLGTVVGVMITFAAIAAAGDVNINAIAPGISAALLATVAGLAVAIPALFGYNYIVIRNRNITANMNVFVDEFLTRVSELFSERGAASRAGH